MLKGELSNELAPAVGVRFERILKTEEGKLNKQGKGFLEKLMGLDINTYIITTQDRRRVMAFLAKWRVPYTNVFEADTKYEIPDIAREQDMITYYDVDVPVLQNINTRGNKKVKGELWTQAVDS